ncbi:MAG: glycosyltransferase [Nitrospirae bacterium]|nr:glycosyltransferase [Nitrospirota bacterium]
MEILALIILMVYLIAGTEALLGARTLRFLKETPPLEGEMFPRISLIIAARNEKKNIETALQSVLNQDYPELEVMIIDDRSTDGTSAIMDRIGKKYPNLKVFHVSELPDGWLGKNHALYSGAQKASGEFLLFMDADVVMEFSTVRRTLGYLIEKRLDHVTVFPELKLKGIWLNMVVGAFSIIFGLYTRPWKAKDPKSRHHIGIGAFNLVKAEVYRKVGTHQKIAMRPDDDMKLAKLIKKGGFRQDCLLGKGMIFVEWYSSLSGLVHGLEKNAFASVNYHLSAVIAATVGNVLFFVWPFAGVFLSTGLAQIFFLFAVIMMVILYLDHARLQGLNPWYGLGFPVANIIFLYIVWNSTLKTLFRHGIEWRDTHYPLEKLRANKI